MFLGDAPEAPGPAVLLLHEAGVEIRLVVRAADWFERRRTDSATARPLEDGETTRKRNLAEEIIFQCIHGYHFHKASKGRKKNAISGCRNLPIVLELERYLEGKTRTLTEWPLTLAGK